MKQHKEKPKATWIWYPGDFEIRLHEKLSLKRSMRGVAYPPFWRVDRHYSNVQFRYVYNLQQEEQIIIASEGTFSFYLDGKDNVRSNDAQITLPAGRHEITISVFNDQEVPSLYLEGENIWTDANWEVTSYQNDWLKAGRWIFHSLTEKPSLFRLSLTPQEAVSSEIRNGHVLLDFGKETFGYLRFHHITGSGAVNVYYGESLAEALSPHKCMTFDRFDTIEAVDATEEGMYRLTDAKAFRYVWIHADPRARWSHIDMLYESLPVIYRSSFECSDPRLTDIYNISLYTLHLNTREFFLDGIKRDQWVWTGDAYQAFLMNYYSFFDLDVTRRTLIALRGKDPLTMHMNTILDYSFYWFISLYDYYLYTGDVDFIRDYYERAVTLMCFCLKQLNEEGLVEGRKQDWIFVDWADLDNSGAVSTEQILLARSLDAMSTFASMVGDEATANDYNKLSKQLISTTLRLFWDDEKGGLLHHRIEGETKLPLTKHANIFAIAFDYFTPAQRSVVIRNVLLNPEVPRIKTPYMRFHELAMLCQSGEHNYVRKEILSYWGGMIELGATTFWEEYDPSLTDEENYSMYGMPYGKSLCHAWGASPIYLIGKYFLGVKPITAGYETFVVEPQLGGLDWFKGTIPTAYGEVEIDMNQERIRVRAEEGSGVLRYHRHHEVIEANIPQDGSWLEVKVDK